MARDINILVVDDIENMRRLITSMLLKLKYHRVSQASSGREAWTKLQNAKEPFDLVISDWNMPQMSGLDLLKAIRKDANFSDLPVLMVTAETVRENIIAAVKFKVNGYIVKPFTPATLEEKIEDIFSKIK